jgi:hypothetical protein
METPLLLITAAGWLSAVQIRPDRGKPIYRRVDLPVMLILLNLTAPPLLMLFLPAAMLGNYTLPAPPASDVAAFGPGGEPLPTWVISGTLYILQGGDPAVAIYVPRFENASGVYRVALGYGDIVIQAPPGVMVESISPTPRDVKINKTGLYLYTTGPAAVTYYFFTVTVKPTTTPTPTHTTPTPTPTPTPTATTLTTQTPSTTPPTTQQPSAAPTLPFEALVAAAVTAAGAGAAVYLLRRGRGGGGGCGDLNETDLAILAELERRGGSMERAALQAALNLPKTTLHRHLHKLARYGYVRLVQAGGGQRVELLSRCK